MPKDDTMKLITDGITTTLTFKSKADKTETIVFFDEAPVAIRVVTKTPSLVMLMIRREDYKKNERYKQMLKQHVYTTEDTTCGGTIKQMSIKKFTREIKSIFRKASCDGGFTLGHTKDYNGEDVVIQQKEERCEDNGKPKHKRISNIHSNRY